MPTIENNTLTIRGEKKHEEKAPAVARSEANPEATDVDKPRRNRQRRRTRGGQASTPE